MQGLNGMECWIDFGKDQLEHQPGDTNEHHNQLKPKYFCFFSYYSQTFDPQFCLSLPPAHKHKKYIMLLSQPSPPSIIRDIKYARYHLISPPPSFPSATLRFVRLMVRRVSMPHPKMMPLPPPVYPAPSASPNTAPSTPIILVIRTTNNHHLAHSLRRVEVVGVRRSMREKGVVLVRLLGIGGLKLKLRWRWRLEGRVGEVVSFRAGIPVLHLRAVDRLRRRQVGGGGVGGFGVLGDATTHQIIII